VKGLRNVDAITLATMRGIQQSTATALLLSVLA